MSKNDINIFYTYIQSQQTAQQYLFRCYQNIDGINAEVKSYENCDAFIYFLKHGKTFYKQGKEVPIELKPVLFFYGMIHLLKATLLTKRPNYPETTKLLAHGVSARKRKKKAYTFMKDEVKIQHHGLFSYFSKHLFSVESCPFEKINMSNLLSIIPEMNKLFRVHKENKLVRVGKMNTLTLSFPKKILNSFHLTERAFIQRITPYVPEIVTVHSNNDSIHLQLTKQLKYSSRLFSFNFSNQSIYFPVNRNLFIPISEIMTHYLLLYNLSMLSRYETEWWGDLLTTRSTIDYPFVTHFLQETAEKVPQLLGQLLYEQSNIHHFDK